MTDEELQARIERLLGGRLASKTLATGGYTPATRWVIALEDGRTAFVKAATNENTALWLRQERDAYHKIEARCMPRVLAFCDDEPSPLMILEDLSAAHWPPPWSEPHLAQARAGLDDLHKNARAEDLPSMQHLLSDALLTWKRIAESPAEFVSLGVASEPWLKRALPDLLAAQAQVSLEGTDVCHLDVRSDNVCLTADGAIFVDWNFACVGNGEVDTGFWMPTLSFETGRAPEDFLPDVPHIAAMVAGYFASHAGQPQIPEAPGVRALQKRQLHVALPWAIRALGLEPLDGDLGALVHSPE